MITSAIIGGVLLAAIEGISIALTRFGAEQFKPGKIGVFLIVLRNSTASHNEKSG